MYETNLLDGVIDLRKITRVTVVSHRGRVLDLYDEYSDGVELHLQDDGQTLKIFPRKESSNE